jgi:hypothetical protein
LTKLTKDGKKQLFRVEEMIGYVKPVLLMSMSTSGHGIRCTSGDMKEPQSGRFGNNSA